MKKLITSGCSFSECISAHIDTWPRHLARLLPDYSHISKAMGSQGNGLISRGIIYEVNEQLKTNESEDLLVGIVWSDPSRHDFYLEPARHLNSFKHNTDGWIENPTGFIPGIKNWVLINSNWKSEYSKEWYMNFHSDIGQYITTLEHILRTQWFLEKHNIKYFMSTHTSHVLPVDLQHEPSTAHLYDQIDFTRFLPIEGIADWCGTGGEHPSTEQHKQFTEEVIMPFIELNFK